MKRIGMVLAAVAVLGLTVSVGQTAEKKRKKKEGGGWVSLFDGKDLTGWKQLNGTAKYAVEDGVIVGTTVEGSPNSFLCTEKNYGDFDLEFEVKCDPRLNSGVQFRSAIGNVERTNKKGTKNVEKNRVHGYQVEIAANSNSGRIYDEARRATWLDKEEPSEAAKKAYKPGEWNKYRVMCQGDSIKTWVNDVPVVDIHDSMTKTGFIGLQVHAFAKSEKPAQVCWRNIRIRELSGGEKAKAEGK